MTIREEGYAEGYRDGYSKRDEEIVRCKDCRYWQDNNGGYPNPECPWGKEETPDPDDYCSFGERKDGDDDCTSPS